VPESEHRSDLEKAHQNVIHLQGPFLGSRLSAALQKADALRSKIRVPGAHTVRADEMVVALSRLGVEAGPDMDTSVSNGTVVDPQSGKCHKASESGMTELQLVETASMAVVDAKLAPPKEVAHPRSSKPAALLVDDNAINLRILTMYCKKRGLPYYTATNGSQAINLYHQQQSASAAGRGAGIELVLMDLQMPVCDGIEATRRIRLLEEENSWRRSVVFIVTGQDSPADRASAEDAGADDFMVKPVGIKLLDCGVQRYFPAFEV
jgi:CheY-like chemotaxis protein